MRDARGALCDGATDFVYGVSKFPPFFVWSPTNPAGNGLKDELAESMIQSIIQRRETEIAASLRYPPVMGTSWAAATVQSWDAAESAEKFNPSCKDLFTQAIPPFLLEAYQRALAVRSHGAIYQDCSDADLQKKCEGDSIAGNIARGLCPVSCGCSRPDSQLVLAGASAGCPPTCRAQPSYENVLLQASCNDTSAYKLFASGSSWTRFGDQAVLTAIASSWPKAALDVALKINTTMRLRGCGAIHALRNDPSLPFPVDLCNESPQRGLPLRSLRLFCPASCNCTSRGVNCPRSCPRE